MSIVVNLVGGGSQKITLSTSSAQSATINATECVVHSTVDCYFRHGTNPTAVSDGTDQYLPADTLMRLTGLTPGSKLAFIGTGSGTLHLSPGA